MARAMTTATDDPIRAEVERVLHVIVAATVTGPVLAVTAVPRCLVRRACALRRRLGEPARVARSLFDLVGAGPVHGVISQDDAPAADEPAARRAVADPPSASPSDDHLPIDEYESLAASQVVARLPTLRRDELETVRTFEAGHRGRRTILGKIDQLLT
jgi:hypothetical protein